MCGTTSEWRCDSHTFVVGQEARERLSMDENTCFSFEFFPPRSADAQSRLQETVTQLDPLRACFVSVTYGAGGSSQDATLETLSSIQGTSSTPVAGHLTCVDASRADVNAVAHRYLELGIRHIVALRGDRPQDGGRRRTSKGDYVYANELVAGLKHIADFEISVAGYPETHPEATSAEADLDALKRKVDAGADRIITQFCFDSDLFLRFVDRVRAAGIEIPVAAGILPISNFERTVEFARVCGASVPQWILEAFSDLNQQPTTRQLLAATVALEQCRYMRAHGVDHFHFYTLNRSELTSAICRLLQRPTATHPAPEQQASLATAV